MNLKQGLVALVILIVLGVGFGYWASKTGPISAPVGETGDKVITQEGQYYSAEAHYPAERPAVKAAMEARVAEFVQNVGSLDATVMPSLQDRKLAFAAEYKTYHGQDGSTSYAYTVYEDTGGAHPNTYFATFVFDAQGNQVTIQDVLKNNPNGLEELSLLVSNDVVAQYKARAQVDDTTGLLYAEGLAPTEENFSNFAIDGDTLLILIPPYQVAAYAVGSFEVRIPLKDIQ